MAKLNPVTYVRSVVEESKKVIWPSRELVLRHTGMVVATIIVSTIIFAGLDYGLQHLVVVAITK
jgi:preprotein translocase SecE subunit